MNLNVWESVQHVHHKRNTRLYVTDGEPLMAKYQVIVTQDEDGMYVVECPTIPGCVSEGKTVEAALANIKEAIQACLETRRELGMPLTVDVYEVEV
ncbi:putative RNase H-like HicB family nuclease [Tumebacillus sp. BK434]|uniref:type II toxin-antitoxin system HicB family antitoxin n=1 Tax=Tumebacillus sp. BK434 TaxID=2512169 RepID=UPI0010EEEF44|nr:type II toxin-antitoxin system HicB family antitoxin [Tumebacillus sp. BK434]TCP57604.1 putative RNase H-like HicB family nuclease [Tumebacillus sp. BK434]